MEVGFHLLPDNKNDKKKLKEAMLNPVFYWIDQKGWAIETHLYLNQRKTLWCLEDHTQYNCNHNRGSCPEYKNSCLKYKRKDHYLSCCTFFPILTRWMSIFHLKIIFSLLPFKTRISTLVKIISKNRWTTTLETNETNFVHKKSQEHKLL